MSRFARHFNWMVILACWTLYALAFAFPAVAQDKFPRPTFDPSVVHDLSGLSGRDAFAATWKGRHEVWLANPALWLGTIFLAWRLWSCAAVVAFVGLGFSLLLVENAVPRDTAFVYGTGYWLWASSLGLLLAGSLAGWRGVVPRHERRSPAEVFRGWRGVALGSGIGAAVVVVVVWWEWHKDVSPPPLWRAGVIIAWATLGMMALAVEWLEDGRRPRLWPLLVVWNFLVLGLIAVAMWWFWDDIYPPRPPR